MHSRDQCNNLRAHLERSEIVENLFDPSIMKGDRLRPLLIRVRVGVTANLLDSSIKRLRCLSSRIIIVLGL
jgi:hypothetical protein